MSGKEANTDRKKVDTNYNDVTEFPIDHLSLLRKTSPDFTQDPESLSICPLLTPSPTAGEEYQNMDPLSQALEQKILLTEKSPSPDFNQDEETALLASSPLASYSHPLEPLTNLAFDLHTKHSGTESKGESSNQSGDINDVLYRDSNSSNAKQIAGTPSENFIDCNRNNFSTEPLESSASSSSFALPENISSTQLLGNHYQHLNDSNSNNAGDFICQETSKGIPFDLPGLAPPPDFSFISWNWPLIRKSCFWTIVSGMIAGFCILVALLVTVPKRCFPPHTWYQGTVFYEIFPASYQDSNGDGIGDLRGIASRVDYLSRLGIKAVRLNSIFPADHYPESFDKITNLTSIDKTLGNFKDFDYLINAMKMKNISVILDFPIYPYLKNLSERKVTVRTVADKITNVVLNHRSHRSLENKTTYPLRELEKSEFVDRKRYLKPYIDGGIAGLMKSNSDHLNLISRTIVEEAVEFWFKKGVDGIYLKGLENYNVNDMRFLQELKKLRNIKENFRGLGYNKMFMCGYKVLDFVTDEETISEILTTMDLLDVYLDVSNGTSHIKREVKKYQESRLYDKQGFPWIHWNIGNVETKRLAGKVENNFGAILFLFLLPGTISIFYGDEIGLTEIHDPHLDHRDVKYIHHLAPMKWQPNGTGFTRIDTLPWLPYAKCVRTNNIHEKLLSNMTSLRTDAPSIYMNSVWKDEESLSNYAFRFVDENVIVLERNYPRRNSYVVVYNAGTDEAKNDLSGIYYRGELLEDSRGRSGLYISFSNINLESGEAFVVKLDK